MELRFEVIEQFHRARNEPHDARRPIDVILAEVVGEGGVVDAVVFQGQHETGAVQEIFGNLVGAVKLPKSLIQRMIHLMELVRAWDAEFFQAELLINALESHLSGGVEVPQRAVEVEEYVLVLCHFESICRCHSNSATAAAWLTLSERVGPGTGM